MDPMFFSHNWVGLCNCVVKDKKEKCNVISETRSWKTIQIVPRSFFPLCRLSLDFIHQIVKKLRLCKDGYVSVPSDKPTYILS